MFISSGDEELSRTNGAPDVGLTAGGLGGDVVCLAVWLDELGGPCESDDIDEDEDENGAHDGGELSVERDRARDAP